VYSGGRASEGQTFTAENAEFAEISLFLAFLGVHGVLGGE